MADRSNPVAGKPAPASLLVNTPRLITAYFSLTPDPDNPVQKVAFGTSGHRGSAFAGSFNEAHILAISQAVCLYRQKVGVDGPLFLGMDTHGLSEPAFASAIAKCRWSASGAICNPRSRLARASANLRALISAIP